MIPQYRCVCIYETYKSPAHIELRIEVCQGANTKSLSPFIRKVDMEELWYACVPESRCLLPLLNQMGLIKQPFRISGLALSDTIVQSFLRKNPWSGTQVNGKGSVKKTAPILLASRLQNLSKGLILNGELYITNIANWNKNIKVRLVYQDALVSFYPRYSKCPYLTSTGTLMLRDSDAEKKLLSDLGANLNLDLGEVTFPEYDIDRLALLAEKGWKVLVSQSKGPASQVYLKHHPSGINWFTSDSNSSADNTIIEQMLNNYLQGRNYIDSKGKLSLFRAKDITQIETELLSESLPSFNIKQLYVVQHSLTETETADILASVSSGVKAQLRSYQQAGVLWLSEMRKKHHGCLLADEMGLGKTLQVLAYLYSLGYQAGKPHLVIAPTSLVYNWQNEIAKFIPSWQEEVAIQLHQPDADKRLLIVSYDILRLNIEAFQRIEYSTIVIDEAQIIKNRYTKKYKAIKTLKAQHLVILTGTPIENSIDDIWSHFMLLMPEMKTLYALLSKQCQSKRDEAFLEMSRKFLKPFILRRTKQEVLKDLPELIEKTIYIEMSNTERHLYGNLHKMVLQALTSGVSGRIESIALEGLLRLRQACVSPKLLPNSIYKGINTLISSKLQTALDYIEMFCLKEEKVLVFSQFVGALEEMEHILDERKIRYEKIYGDTRDRVSPIGRFQKDKDITVFLISLKAGGVGLNLTAASNVILLDDWWNPAVEDQAFARAHRIGQKRNVMVFRLICKDTVEEKVLQLQEKKRQTIDVFNSASGKLSMDELQNLLK